MKLLSAFACNQQRSGRRSKTIWSKIKKKKQRSGRRRRPFHTPPQTLVNHPLYTTRKKHDGPIAIHVQLLITPSLTAELQECLNNFSNITLLLHYYTPILGVVATNFHPQISSPQRFTFIQRYTKKSHNQGGQQVQALNLGLERRWILGQLFGVSYYMKPHIYSVCVKIVSFCACVLCIGH